MAIIFMLFFFNLYVPKQVKNNRDLLEPSIKHCTRKTLPLLSDILLLPQNANFLLFAEFSYFSINFDYSFRS